MMADGDVFVFGRLCGRVVAGLGSHSHPLPTNTTSSGDLQHGGEAMYQIFATSFEPSLVGIGSVFVIPDDHLDCGKLKSKAVNVSIRRKETLAGDRMSAGSVVSIPCEAEDGKVEMVFRAIPI